jgi:hypothetical protein
LEALLLGRRMSGDLPRPTHPDLRRMSEDLPRSTAPDLRSPPQPLMAGRAMATAQGPTRTPRSSILPREDGAEPNRTVINFAGRHSGDRQLASFVTASIPLVWSHRTIRRTSFPAVRLRPRRERPRGRTAEQRDELAPLHSITSSASASNLSGISRPRAFAVLRLITNSNFVDCWTGKLAGFSPLRMRPA